MQKFREKRSVGRTLITVGWGILLLVLEVGSENRADWIFIGMLAVAAIIVLILPLHYRIDRGCLIIPGRRPLSSRVSIKSIDIIRVRGTRIDIHYWENGGGEDVRVRPEEPESLVAALRAINPEIRVEPQNA